MEHSDTFIVDGNSYQSIFSRLGPEFSHFERRHNWPNSTIQVDATGFFWILGQIDCDQFPLSYLRNDQKWTLRGQQLIFFGTHSIVRWSIPAGELQWAGLISALRPPQFLENEVWALEVKGFFKITSPREIFNFFCQNLDQLRPIGSMESSSAIGERIKQKIDQTYNQRSSDSLIGQQLKLPDSLITRYFKACYGITPVEYRNRKRIYDAVGLIMMTSLTMKEIASTVGFGEICRFNRNFTKYLGCCPTDFCHHSRKYFAKSSSYFLDNPTSAM